MAQRPFQQVDVFTDTPYLGNPLAVVLDGSGLDTAAMQRFTDWSNLSECSFVLPPTDEGHAAGADYRVRIFCPGRELPFAGHPTLGTCHAWLQAGGQPRAASHVVQECGVGLVRIRRQTLPLAPVGSAGPPQGDHAPPRGAATREAAERGSSVLAFAAPPLRRSGPLDDADLALIARGLGLARDDIVAHAWCDNGPAWRGVMLRSAQQVLAVRPDANVLAGLEIGLVGPQPAGSDTAFEVRAFFPGHQTLSEDPVTGSLNAAVAQWLIGAGMAPAQYVAAQGTAMGRAGRVQIDRDADGSIWVGGASVTCIRGEVTL